MHVLYVQVSAVVFSVCVRLCTHNTDQYPRPSPTVIWSGWTGLTLSFQSVIDDFSFMNVLFGISGKGHVTTTQLQHYYLPSNNELRVSFHRKSTKDTFSVTQVCMYVARLPPCSGFTGKKISHISLRPFQVKQKINK